MPFQIHALPSKPFEPYFAMSDDELAKRNACRMTVAEHPGTPCRVSLRDAAIGETVVLVNHVHQPAKSPYQATHAIFVREGAVEAQPKIGAIPEVLAARLISVRCFDADDMMIDADVVEGTGLEAALVSAFEDKAVAYIHLHNAKPGCFAASVTRA